MPTRNVDLTDTLDRFVADRIASGKYENANEVVSAALRELERHEANEALKMERLRRLLEEGEASGIDEDVSLDGLLAELDDGIRSGRMTHYQLTLKAALTFARSVGTSDFVMGESSLLPELHLDTDER